MGTLHVHVCEVTRFRVSDWTESRDFTPVTLAVIQWIANKTQKPLRRFCVCLGQVLGALLGTWLAAPLC